ncbi:hypothetical protein ABPG73_003067 [Tetrahymena malaccensis]
MNNNLLQDLSELQKDILQTIPDSKKEVLKLCDVFIIKGLSLDIDENNIRNYLEENCGPVSSVNLCKNEEGLSQGIAQVSFQTGEGSSKVIKLNNSEFMGKQLSVEKINPQAQTITPLVNDQVCKTSFDDKVPLNNDRFINEVIVKGLSFFADEKYIFNYFNKNCGPVSRVNLIKNDIGTSKGIAFISFKTEEGCRRAVELNNSQLMDKYLTIKQIYPKAERFSPLLIDEDSKIIFVGNLSYQTEEVTIRNFFELCGNIVDVRFAKYNGKSKGFCHVEFEDRSGVENALKKQGEFIDGRPIKINVAQKRSKREDFNSDFESNDSEYIWIKKTDLINERIVEEDSKIIFVDNLSIDTDEETLYNFFMQCGNIVDIFIAKCDGKSQGFCRIQFQDGSGVEKALNKQGENIDGRPININIPAKRNTNEEFNHNLCIAKNEQNNIGFSNIELEDKLGESNHSESTCIQPMIEQININTARIVDEESKIIFVGNLSYNTDEETIWSFFMSCGDIVDIRISKYNGKSKGFCHVEFKDRSGVENALKRQGEQIDGRSIHINVAAKRSNWKDFNTDLEQYDSQQMYIQPMNEKLNLNTVRTGDEDFKIIFVGNLSFRTDEETIWNFFMSCGDIVDVRISRYNGKSKGFCHVEFKDRSGVENALKRQGQQIDGRFININIAAKRSNWKDFNTDLESNNSEQMCIQPMNEKLNLNTVRIGDEDSKIIFVGNLSFKTDEEAIQNFFTQCGDIVDVRISRYNGKSKGFCHVEFRDRSGVENALKKQGEQIDEMPIRIDVAAKRIYREDFNRGFESNNSEFMQKQQIIEEFNHSNQNLFDEVSKTILVGNLFIGTDEEIIEQHFMQCGKIVEVCLAKYEGKSKGFCYIEFEDRFGVENALKKQGEYIDGRPIKIEVVSSKWKCQDFNTNFEQIKHEFMGIKPMIENINLNPESNVDEDSKIIFFSNLSLETDEEILQNFFKCCGNITDVQINKCEEKSQGFGHIKFEDKSGAKNALLKSGEYIDGRPITVTVTKSII